VILPLDGHSNVSAITVCAFVRVSVSDSCAGAFSARVIPPLAVNFSYSDCNQELLSLHGK
jgi:hypothetical protein